MREFFLSYKGLLILFVVGTIIFGGLTTFLIYKEKSSPQKQASPYQKQIDKLDSINTLIDQFTTPLNSRIIPETFRSQKQNMQIDLEATKDALAKSDIKTAHERLIKVKNQIMNNLGDPAKSKFVPKDLKQKHDPKDKYIQFDSVDPQVYNLYFITVDILVETDKSY